MKRALQIGVLLCCALLVAGFGGLGSDFGKLGASRKRGVVVPQPTGKILLVDAASFLLQTDGTSKVCRAGGC